MAREAAARYSEVEQAAQDYYDDSSADNFYRRIWGGEDLHVGIYERPDEDIFVASNRAVDRIADRLEGLSPESRVLDIGAGYGGSMRTVAQRFGCSVACLNISRLQNDYNREKNAAAGLADRIEVTEGSFEDLPYRDASFDVVWSQDAILHSGRRARVLEEASRVLTANGRLIFTDIMQKPDAPADKLGPVLARVNLDTMGTVPFYEKTALAYGLSVEQPFEDLTENIPVHYARVRETLQKRYGELSGEISKAYYDNAMKGLAHWVEAGNSGLLQWGILEFRKG